MIDDIKRGSETDFNRPYRRYKLFLVCFVKVTRQVMNFKVTEFCTNTRETDRQTKNGYQTQRHDILRYMISVDTN